MKRTRIDMNPERQIVTNMIVSDQFLREITPIFKASLLKTEYAREVATWIEEYWKQYQQAPGKDIQSIYQHKKEQLQNEDEAENIAEFLGRLSAEWEQNQVNNVKFSLDNAVRYLKNRSFEILKDQLEIAIADGNVLQGEQFIANYTRIVPPSGEGIRLLRDTAKVAAAFLEEEETLFQFPGILGDIAGDFHRGDFFAYLAPMKRGKTQHLWYLAEQAASHGLKVVFVTFEMTENQMIRRAWQSLVGAPKKDCEVMIPYFTEGPKEKLIVENRMEFRKQVDVSRIDEFQKIFRKYFRRGDIKIISLPSATSVDDLEATIDNLAFYEGFVPDVIALDYADLLTPSKGFRGEYRHGIDDIWKRLRRMSQKRNILMATVSQSDRNTFSSDITEKSVSEDIRKLAHVTSMVGLNQTKGEKAQQIMRMSQLAIREGRSILEQGVILYCYDIGRAVIDSRLEKEVLITNKETGEEEEEVEKTPHRTRYNR